MDIFDEVEKYTEEYTKKPGNKTGYNKYSRMLGIYQANQEVVTDLPNSTDFQFGPQDIGRLHETLLEISKEQKKNWSGWYITNRLLKDIELFKAESLLDDNPRKLNEGTMANPLGQIGMIRSSLKKRNSLQDIVTTGLQSMSKRPPIERKKDELRDFVKYVSEYIVKLN
jgi:hypothetical protein